MAFNSTNTTKPDPPTRTSATAVPHRFNRYEIKYLVAEKDLPRLREEFADYLDRDPMAPPAGYRVESLYYDSQDLRFYWEKIEGLKFRRKLRVRRYGEGETTAQSPVTVEIKQRMNRVTQKRRLELPLAQALSLCDASGSSTGTRLRAEDLYPVAEPRHHGLLSEIETLVDTCDLRPIAMTAYRREPYVGRDLEDGVRVTFDHAVTGRDRDLRLGMPDTINRPLVPNDCVVMEIKADERVPLWLTDVTARCGLTVIRMSKYCRAIDQYDVMPASATGAVDRIL